MKTWLPRPSTKPRTRQSGGLQVKPDSGSIYDARIAARSLPSVRHSVHDVIDPHPKSQRGKFLRITGIVGPFPGVAEVHVVADSYHDAAPVVADCAPSRDVAILFVGSARAYVLFAGHLETLAQVIEHVENFILVGQVFDGAVREHHQHAAHEALPIGGAMEIVDHDEAALEQVFAQALGLGFGEGPVLYLDGVDPGVVEDFVAVELHDLFGRPGLNASETPQSNQELAVRLRIIPGPTRPSAVPVTPAVTVGGSVAKPRPGILTLGFAVFIALQAGLPCGTELIILLIPSALEGEQARPCTHEQNDNRNACEEPHRLAPK